MNTPTITMEQALKILREAAAGVVWCKGDADAIDRAGVINTLSVALAATAVDKVAPAVPDDAVRELLQIHATMLESGPYAYYCYFELAYTRYTGWMAWICSNQREQDPDRKVLAKGQGDTPDEACRAALAFLAAAQQEPK